MIVKVKSSSDYQLFDQCHLGISIGNANARGRALESIIQWINQQDFKHCFIDLSDTLHRHNFMYQFSKIYQLIFFILNLKVKHFLVHRINNRQNIK